MSVVVPILALFGSILLIYSVFRLPKILSDADRKRENDGIEANRLSDNEIDLIFKGIRPDGMSKEDFDLYRKDKENHVRERLKGQLYFKSHIPQAKTEGNKIVVKKHSTYERRDK
jgi:hypothetical protein